MTTLNDFLLARVAEDESVARAAADGTPQWEYAEAWGSWRVQSVALDRFGGHSAITFDREGLSDSVSDLAGPHIERFDPARALAECEAKRRIVEMWSARNDQADHLTIAAHATGLGLAIRALAVVYADHPEYDEKWRP